MSLNLKYKSLILLIIFSLTILFEGGGCMDNNDNQSFGNGISEDIAKDKVYEFLKKEGVSHPKDYVVANLESSGTKNHPNLGELLIFTGSLGEFWVTANRGNVITFNAPSGFTITEAEKYIGEYLGKHIPEFGLRSFVKIEAKAEGQLWIEEWREEPKDAKEKSIFPNWISISVNLVKRSVNNFNYSDLRRTRFTDPAINEASARTKILQRFPDGEILEIELMEHTGDGGLTWITIWNAVVQPYDDPDDPNELISINADTGENVPL